MHIMGAEKGIQTLMLIFFSSGHWSHAVNFFFTDEFANIVTFFFSSLEGRVFEIFNTNTQNRSA